MNAVITSRGSLPEKLHRAGASHGVLLDDVVRSTRGLSAHRRMGIYTNGYVLRLLECLRDEYPVLRTFMGDQMFDLFAKAYIVCHPSRSYSLYHLGREFSRFLRDTRPRLEDTSIEDEALLDLPAEIAALERANGDVSRAEGTETRLQGGRSLADAVDAAMVLQGERTIRTPRCLRVLEQQFPLIDFFRSVAQGENPEPPARRISRVAVSRVDYRIQMIELAQWQYEFLLACRDPISVPAAAALAAERCNRPVSRILADLMIWLPLADEEGLIVQ